MFWKLNLEYRHMGIFINYYDYAYDRLLCLGESRREWCADRCTEEGIGRAMSDKECRRESFVGSMSWYQVYLLSSWNRIFCNWRFKGKWKKRFIFHPLTDMFIPINLTSLGSIQPCWRLFVHISTTVYSQVLTYTAKWNEATWRKNKIVQGSETPQENSNSGFFDWECGILSRSYRPGILSPSTNTYWKFMIVLLNSMFATPEFCFSGRRWERKKESDS